MIKKKYKEIAKKECPHLYHISKCHLKSETRSAECKKNSENLSCCFSCEDECETNCKEIRYFDLMKLWKK